MRYVTTLLKSGRLGHQLKDWFTSVIASEEFGLQYVHYPLSRRARKWEKFLSFGDGEIAYRTLKRDRSLRIVDFDETAWYGMPLSQVQEKIEIDSEADHVLYRFSNSARLMLESVDHSTQDRVLDRIRTKYWAARDKAPVPAAYRSDQLNVSLYVRRGGWRQDISRSNPNDRYQDCSYFLNIVNNLLEVLDPAGVDIHVYSEGTADELRDFYEHGAPNLTVHRCDNSYPQLYNIFHHILISDIQVTGSSAFSYALAHLTQNIVMCFPHDLVIPMQERDRLLHTDGEGEFSRERLVQLVRERHGPKVLSHTP